MSIQRASFTKPAEAVPPQAWFGVSAIFHYLGPSFAVLLFPTVGVLGVAWLRIATAAAVFAPWTKPWRAFVRAGPRELALLPATATIIGVIVLAQVPSAKDVLGILLVMVGVAVHKPAPPLESAEGFAAPEASE